MICWSRFVYEMHLRNVSCSARARATPCAAIKSCDLLRHAGSAQFSSLILSLSIRSSLFLAIILSSFLCLSFVLSLSLLFLVHRSLSALHLLIRRAFPFPRVSAWSQGKCPTVFPAVGNACREKLPLAELSRRRNCESEHMWPHKLPR